MLKFLTDSPEFMQVMKNLTEGSGTHTQMLMGFIRDVSSMLCFVSEVRKLTIERNLAPEYCCQTCFASGHDSYAHDLTY